MRWVETESALEQTVSALGGAEVVFLDTEFDSSRNGTVLSLLQISRGAEVYVIDALRLPSIRQLERVLSDPKCVWVLHAGSQDVTLLCDALDLRIRPQVFDTQVAWSLLSAEYSVSLPYLLNKLLKQRVAKGYQADDWLRRPLPDAQIAYAADDVEYLPALYADLLRMAEAKARTQLIRVASAESVWPEKPAPPKISLESFRNAWQLDAPSQAGLLALLDWYNGLDTRARKDAPDPKILLAIASRMPESADALGRIKGVPRYWVERQGRDIVRRLKEAAQSAKAEDFVPIEPPPYGTFEQVRLDAWLSWVRAELCVELSVSPEAAMPQKVVRQVRDSILLGTRTEDGAEGLEGWRRELLLEKYLAWCERLPFRLNDAVTTIYQTGTGAGV
ncbi:MAG: hypothetical protein SFV15_09910 [Polyangiaceae bacterium]|nr:hypothetical protein [Polyangiaceae bacterium]